MKMLTKLYGKKWIQKKICKISESLADSCIFIQNGTLLPTGISFPLLINLEYWREHHLLSAFKDFMKNHADRIVYHDQDVLNYVLQDSKKELPVKFNLQQGFLWRNKPYPQKYIKEIKEAINDCVILHFTGPNPWYKSCRHPYRNTFLKYKANTIWKDEPLIEDRPMSVRTKKAIATILRKCKLIPELPPYGKGYLPGLKPLD